MPVKFKNAVRETLIAGIAGMAVCAVSFGSAWAEDFRRDHFERHDHHEFHEFHGRSVRLFDPLEFSWWSGGRWVEGWYGNQYGWWWLVGGRHYYYSRPIYPYPPEVSEIWVPSTEVIQQQQGIVTAPPPPPGAGYAPPPPQQQMWYYCDNPAGYYPYVQSCPTPFRAVPAQPR